MCAAERGRACPRRGCDEQGDVGSVGDSGDGLRGVCSGVCTLEERRRSVSAAATPVLCAVGGSCAKSRSATGSSCDNQRWISWAAAYGSQGDDGHLLRGRERAGGVIPCSDPRQDPSCRNRRRRRQRRTQTHAERRRRRRRLDARITESNPSAARAGHTQPSRPRVPFLPPHQYPRVCPVRVPLLSRCAHFSSSAIAPSPPRS